MYKLFWFFRCFLLSLFYKDIKFPSYIGKPVYIHGLRHIRLGKKVRIFPSSRLEVHENKQKNAYIHIHDDVSIGQSLHIISQGQLDIYSGTVISSNVMITNVDHEYEDITKPILEQPHKVSKTVIGENCFIGTGAVLQAGTILGRHCIVGANAVVRGEFPDNCVIVGAPARMVKIYDKETNKWVRC